MVRYSRGENLNSPWSCSLNQQSRWSRSLAVIIRRIRFVCFCKPYLSERMPSRHEFGVVPRKISQSFVSVSGDERLFCVPLHHDGSVVGHWWRKEEHPWKMLKNTQEGILCRRRQVWNGAGRNILQKRRFGAASTCATEIRRWSFRWIWRKSWNTLNCS